MNPKFLGRLLRLQCPNKLLVKQTLIYTPKHNLNYYTAFNKVVFTFSQKNKEQNQQFTEKVDTQNIDFDFDSQQVEEILEKFKQGELDPDKDAPVDDMLNSNDIFKTREQQLSFTLLETKTPSEVVAIYRQTIQDLEKQQQEALNANQLVIFFYFASFSKEDLSSFPEVKEIIRKIFDQFEGIEVANLVTFLWSLGIYKFNHSLSISEQNKAIISNYIKTKIYQIPSSQISTFCFALSQIFDNEKDKAIFHPILQTLSQQAVKEIELIPKVEKLNLLLTFANTQLIDFQNTEKIAMKLFEERSELTEDDVLQIITALSDLRIPNSKVIVDFARALFQREIGVLSEQGKEQESDSQNGIEGHQNLNKPGTSAGTQQLTVEQLKKKIANQEMKEKMKNNNLKLLQHTFSPDVVCGILLSLSSIPKNKPEQLILNYIKLIEGQVVNLNISSYINIWLALARSGIPKEKITTFIEEIQKGFTTSNYFKSKEFEDYQLVNIVVAMSVLQINDQQFMLKIVKGLEPKLEKMHQNELINLARSFVVYVKQFEDFYIKIHNACVGQINNLEFSQKDLLTKNFMRTKVLFPGSPFIPVQI